MAKGISTGKIANYYKMVEKKVNAQEFHQHNGFSISGTSAVGRIYCIGTERFGFQVHIFFILC